MASMRLDKFLGEMGIASRSQIKEMAKKGRIAVNGQMQKRSDCKIEPEKDRIEVDGKYIPYTAVEYWMLNKPKGVVSATEDNRYPTVVSLVKEAKRKDLFPVGRLDIDTEGLLLLTNDGDLAHRLLSPKNHVDKVYVARIEGELPADCCAQVENGLVLEDGTKTLPGKLEILSGELLGDGGALPPNFPLKKPAGTKIRLTIQEGKFHQVKRMVEALGCRVVDLKRISMGAIVLDDGLAPGEYRALTEEEKKLLGLCVGGSRKKTLGMDSTEKKVLDVDGSRKKALGLDRMEDG